MAQGATQAAGARISAEILKSGSENTKKLFMTYSKFIKSLMCTVHGDRVILELLILISLFSTDRICMEQHTEIQHIQEHYAFLLQCYVGHRFPSDPTLFARIVMKLVDLRDINEVHSDMLLHLKVDELDPLLVEIFELPPPSEFDDMETDGDLKKPKQHPDEIIKGGKAEPDISSAGDIDMDSGKGKLPPSPKKLGYAQDQDYIKAGNFAGRVYPDSSLKEQQEGGSAFQSEQVPSVSPPSSTTPTLSIH
ncbi:hypothetical protein EGW08_020991 [Elysia chlorotica]|uniref:NR LBD domain-containing protein n=1 Tax=Elysia chlorotica TaxID=188477 RepID=A0A3S1AXZ8_ELYCH|nr:hypothetical protein EGW08_020991 [Elysia chlorotica]